MRKVVKNAKDVSEEKLKELKENAFGILCEARRELLVSEPFIGSIAMNLDIVPVRDIRLPTAATDGGKIYFDIDFLSSLNRADTVFVLAHEVWHCAMSHFIRNEGRDHELFNIATDMEVNQILETDGMTVPENCLMPALYGFKNGLSAEEYYELLLKKKPNKGLKGKGKGQGKQQKGGSGDTNEDTDGEGEGGQPNKNKNGKGNSSSGSGDEEDNDSPMGKSGNREGKLDGQFDKHITDLDDPESDAGNNGKSEKSKKGKGKGKSNGDEDGEGEGEDGNVIADKYGKLGKDKDFNPRPSKEQIDKMREMAVAAAQQYERDRGFLPASMKRFVNELLTPKVDWREVLHSFVTRAMGEKSDWNRPNRRFISSHTYLPSHYGDKLKVCVGIDTSGSTMGDIPRFLGELNGLVKSFGNYELTLIECDAEVGKFEKYDDENPLDLENLHYEMSGGGGTCLKPIFDKIKEENVECDCICIFTDGYTEHFTKDDDPGIPTLWMLTHGCMDNKQNYDFGECCEFEEAKPSFDGDNE